MQIVCSSPLTSYQVTFRYIDFTWQFFLYWWWCSLFQFYCFALCGSFITFLLWKLLIFTYPSIHFFVHSVITFIASVARYDDIFSRILITNKKLQPLPIRRWVHQVGRLDGNGPEKQALSSSEMQTPCLSVDTTWLSNLATAAHWRCSHHRLARTLWLFINIDPASSSRAWPHLDQWGGPNLIWEQAAQPSFELLGALAVLGVDSVTEQQIHPRDISLDTRRLAWTTSSFQPVTLELERDWFRGFCFGQLGENSPMCCGITSCSHT